MIANARMYSVSPEAAAAWRALLARVVADSGVAMEIIDHSAPAKLSDLWARADLGCALMCGWPFVREGGVKTVLAAPVPDAAWSGDEPVYRSDFVVAADAPYTRLEDTFGGRFAFNGLDSHSGYNAPRAHLAAFAGRAPLFSGLVGPLITHQAAVEAVASGRAEIAAIDSFSLQLIRAFLPGLARGVRVLASTDPCPVPAFVASGLGERQAAAVRAALLGLDATEAGRALLAAVCVRRFAPVRPEGYAATQAMERRAIDLGYREIA